MLIALCLGLGLLSLLQVVSSQQVFMPLLVANLSEYRTSAADAHIQSGSGLNCTWGQGGGYSVNGTVNNWRRRSLVSKPITPQELVITRIGCYMDSRPGPNDPIDGRMYPSRALPHVVINSAMSLTWCANYSSSAGYKVFSLQWQSECWYGNDSIPYIVRYGGNATGCNRTCAVGSSGYSQERCGGFYCFNLYKSSTHQAVSAFGLDRNQYGTLQVPTTALDNVRTVSVGAYHGVALLTDGSAVAWGDNLSNQTVIPPTAKLKNIQQISAGGFHTLYLLNDGTAVGAGGEASNTDLNKGQADVPASLAKRVIAMSAGFLHSLFILNDTRVVVIGDNEVNQRVVPPAAAAAGAGIQAVAGGGYHSLALTSQGTVIAWGYQFGPYFSFTGQSTVPSGLTGVQAIAAGGYHSLALRADGTVVGWGSNDSGQISIPANLPRIVAIGAGFYHSIALSYDGRVYVWGLRSFLAATQVNATTGQVTFLTNASGVSAGGFFGMVAIPSVLPSA